VVCSRAAATRWTIKAAVVIIVITSREVREQILGIEKIARWKINLYGQKNLIQTWINACQS
jgi:hypothetical protein